MDKKKLLSIILAFVLFLIIILLPTPADLPQAGQVALGILVLAVTLWITEAVTYPVSAAIIVALISIFIGLSPSLEDPNQVFGTKNALNMAMGGFSSSALGLVAGALFIASAMEATGLHKRIALYIMSKVGTNVNNLIIGTILVSTVLAFFVPSATARAGAIVPILLGIVAALGLPKDSRLSALLTITAVQSISLWNIGIKTAAAQNMVALGFIEDQFSVDISWGEWFLYAAPFTIIMSVVLFFVMKYMIKPEYDGLNNGKQIILEKLKELGPISSKEKRLIIYSITLLFLWTTEGILHPVDSTTVTLAVFALMIMPGIGVYTWKHVQTSVNWGTLIVFAVGISLGTTLLNTEGAQWFSDTVLGAVGINKMPLIAIIAVLSLFNILIHLGFASATSLASAFIPIVIALSTSLATDFNIIGIILIQQFVISFGFLLPVNAPQNMLAYGTGAFRAKDLLKTGIPLTIIGYLMIILFSATYWQWIGLL